MKITLFAVLALLFAGVAVAHPLGDNAAADSISHAKSSGMASVGGFGGGTASASGWSSAGTSVMQGQTTITAPPFSSHTHFGSSQTGAVSGVLVGETGNGFASGGFWNESYSSGLVILP